jgi:hypothetical protein
VRRCFVVAIVLLFLHSLFSRFAYIFGHKMNCLPHLRPKNACKTVFIPHLVIMLEFKIRLLC